MRLRYTVAFIALLVFAVLALALWPPGVNSATVETSAFNGETIIEAVDAYPNPFNRTTDGIAISTMAEHFEYDKVTSAMTITAAKLKSNEYSRAALESGANKNGHEAILNGGNERQEAGLDAGSSVDVHNNKYNFVVADITGNPGYVMRC